MMHTRYFDLRDTKGQQKIIEDQISAAADILRQGGLVGIPTETVYGLGANALDAEAVNKIFEAKGRPQDNPLIIHIPGPQWLPRYCEDVPPLAYTLARKFWPGPLTMILKRKPIVPDTTTAGLDTVGVRCPDHQVTLSIIREAGVPVAAPSANTSGRPSCTTAADVMEDMEGKIDAVVDGGPCQVGVESTILDLTCTPPRLLRPGGLPLEALEEVVGPVAVDKAVTERLKDGEQPKAPGMKYRHYAPKAPVTVVTGPAEASARTILQMVKPGDGVICFDEFAELFKEQEVECLGPSQDKRIQAQRVFDALRAFDSKDAAQIYAQCPDSQGLGLAISNRLKKAAGFKTIAAGQKRVVIGITGGTGDGTFNPNGSCTRAHIVTFLWRAAGSPEPKSTVSFADVPADSYYAKAVAWAVENGITLGTGDGTFSPNATCTRAQSVTFLYRALGTAPTTVNGFTDVTADAFYADAVAWAVESGVTNGTSASTFSPNNGCTRAQIVTFLYRTMK